MNQDDELNKIFREGLSEPGHHAEYREADWNALEKMLNEREKKRGIILWWPVATGIAAMLLLFLGWMFFKPAETGKNKPVIAVNKKQAGGIVGNGSAQQTQQPAPAEQLVATNSTAGTPAADKTTGMHHTATHAQSAQSQNDKQNAARVMAGNRAVIAANKHPRKGSKTTAPVNESEPQTMIAANRTGKANNKITAATDEQDKNENEAGTGANKSAQNNAATAFSDKTFIVNKPEAVAAGVKTDSVAKTTAQIAKQTPKAEVKTTAGLSKTHFALSVLAASNVNGVGSFQKGQMGADIGITFSAGYKRFTLTTGAVYAKTPYATDFSNYHIRYQFPTNPVNVNADCRVLDIPVNVNYQVYGNFKNKFSVGTGLSSYLMLDEKYFYTYASPATVGPAGYEVSNRNKHYFGVLNFDVLYQRRLNSKFSLDLQPYFKLPLTNIGYGKVKLQSAGMAVGFSWNIK